MLNWRNKSRLDRNIIYNKSTAYNILCTFLKFVTFLWCRKKSKIFFSKFIPDQKDFIFQFIFTTYFALHTNLLFYWIEKRSFVIPILLSCFVSFDSWLKIQWKDTSCFGSVIFHQAGKGICYVEKILSSPFQKFPEKKFLVFSYNANSFVYKIKIKGK